MAWVKQASPIILKALNALPACHPMDIQFHQSTLIVHDPSRRRSLNHPGMPVLSLYESPLPYPGYCKNVLFSTPPLEIAPAAISSRMESKDSVRGSSAVKIATSARPIAASAINLRFSRSRSPADPKTVITRPEVICLAVCNAEISALGVWAKSTMAVNFCPRSIRSILPGTPARLDIPFETISGFIPRPSTAAV